MAQCVVCHNGIPSSHIPCAPGQRSAWPVSSPCQFLDETNTQDFLLDIGQQCIDDLRFFDPHPLREDLFHRDDLACLDELSKLGLWDPSYLLTRSPAAALVRSLAHAFASIGAD